MKKITLKTIGIDVSFKTLDICFGQVDSERNQELSAPFTVSNNLSGFKKLLKKIKNISLPGIEILAVMEATGIYHENLAYYLKEQSIDVAIVLPTLMSNYMKSLSLKQLDDKSCSRAIAQFGLERKLEHWSAPDPNFRTLRDLTRERSQIVDERTIVKNKLHASNNKANTHNPSIKRIKERVKLLNKQEKEINIEIQQLVRSIEDIKKNVQIIESIPGMGLISAATVLAETNNFDLIRNKKQLTSYAGLDVVHKISGTSINTKNRISKKGNKFLRKSMHFPALSAARVNPIYKDKYIAITARTGLKMKGLVAVQRKMLELCYSLVKNQQHYIKDYEKSRAQKLGPTQDRLNLPLVG